MQELAQAAYEQEKQRGFLEGREAGAREAAQVATNLADEAARYLNELERAVPSMIIVIVERILGAFDETEFVTRAVRQAVTTLVGTDIRLRVAPEMVEPLRRSLDEDGACDASFLRVEADAGIKPGDCQIVTQAGNIDVGLAAQSRALRNDLQQRLSAIEIAGANWQRAS